MAEEQKVRVVFEFDRKDYENVLFLLDEQMDNNSEKAWEVMTREDVGVSKEMVAKMFGMKQKAVLAMFISIAVLWAKDKIS
jgi:hypothetical protein